MIAVCFEQVESFGDKGMEIAGVLEPHVDAICSKHGATEFDVSRTMGQIAMAILHREPGAAVEDVAVEALKILDNICGCPKHPNPLPHQ